MGDWRSIEITPIGAHRLLFSKASGAMVLDAAPEGDREDALDQETHSAWQRAGLFDQAPYAPQEFVAAVPDQPKSTCLFAVNQAGLALRLADPWLMDQLRCILRAYVADHDVAQMQCLTVETSGPEFTVFDGPTPLTEKITRDEARFFVIRQAAEAMLGPDRVGAVLHSSAVSLSGQGLVFVGASGRGKTTTALGLLRAGAQQVADDHVVIDKTGRAAISFPVPIGLKPGSQALPEARGLQDAGTDALHVREGVRYAQPPAVVEVGQTVPLHSIVFPRFAPGVPAQINRLLPEEALIRTIDAGGRVAGAAQSVLPLARLFNEVPSYEMAYSHSNEARTLCQALLRP